jgi:hypothetical protein
VGRPAREQEGSLKPPFDGFPGRGNAGAWPAASRSGGGWRAPARAPLGGDGQGWSGQGASRRAVDGGGKLGLGWERPRWWRVAELGHGGLPACATQKKSEGEKEQARERASDESSNQIRTRLRSVEPVEGSIDRSKQMAPR